MKYLIVYNAGFGDEAEVAECENQEAADKAAYEAWKEASENNASYSAEILTRENAENYGLEHKLD